MVMCFVMSRTVALYKKKTHGDHSFLLYAGQYQSYTLTYSAKICKDTLINFMYSILSMSVSNKSKQIWGWSSKNEPNVLVVLTSKSLLVSVVNLDPRLHASMYLSETK